MNEDIGVSPPERDEPDAVSVITEALITKFGSGAIDVARRQVEVATDESLRTWLDVLSRLSAPAILP